MAGEAVQAVVEPAEPAHREVQEVEAWEDTCT